MSVSRIRTRRNAHAFRYDSVVFLAHLQIQHFHPEREARIKLLLLSERLGQTKWSRPDPRIASNLQTLNHMFLQRFEGELN